MIQNFIRMLLLVQCSELKTEGKVLDIRSRKLCYNLISLGIDIIDTSDVVVLILTSYIE